MNKYEERSLKSNGKFHFIKWDQRSYSILFFFLLRSHRTSELRTSTGSRRPLILSFVMWYRIWLIYHNSILLYVSIFLVFFSFVIVISIFIMLVFTSSSYRCRYFDITFYFFCGLILFILWRSSKFLLETTENAFSDWLI